MDNSQPVLYLPAPRVPTPTTPQGRAGSFSFVVMVILIGLAGMWPQLNLRPDQPNPLLDIDKRTSSLISSDLNHDFNDSLTEIRQLEDDQAKNNLQVSDELVLQQSISAIQLDIDAHEFSMARQDLAQLDANLAVWRKDYDARLQERQLSEQLAAANPNIVITAPIMIYHFTPPDFENQLIYLRSHGYTTIDLDQLAAALAGRGGLPAKPIVLTFDDGFEDQIGAFRLLQKYQMKGTFYIIDGGPDSTYHIGANRRLPDPQGGAGYLTWDEIREIDRDPNMTIASHTVDHLALANQSPDVQRFEIFEGKKQLEQQLGHLVKHFAYPYGSYNATTIELVRQAGFITATSTVPGTVHTPTSLYALHRARSVYTLR
ncbi:MAG TPA: polysaccharide deacetylase family protein [Candidatus Nanoarchaeia archaeon]|nr:polysaccharide deacetylase family protein [Candidatus Nanoarchaeia archaeon]